jgi:hypothetical protein
MADIVAFLARGVKVQCNAQKLYHVKLVFGRIFVKRCFGLMGAM